MSFTYLGTLTTDLDTIRFKVSDTVSGSGVKPQGANFTDEEIAGLLAIEGTVDRTVAAIYETLEVTYANFIDAEIGSRSEKNSQISARYANLAKVWRDNVGYGSSSTMIATGFVTRQDGYSDDLDSGQA